MPGEFWPVKISWRKIVFSAVKRFVTSDICICFRPHARAHCLSVCLSVCLCARLLKNACMDLDEMLRVDRCRDMDELINFSARYIS